MGDEIVYAAHGVGRIVAREQRDVAGAKRECVVIDLVNGLRVQLALEDAAERLRSVAKDAEIEQVAAILAAAPRSREVPWPKRMQTDKAKLATGSATELAELVRDGALIEMRGNGSRLSQSERRLYLQARELLVREIAWVREIDSAEVEAWIDAQVGKSPGFED